MRSLTKERLIITWAESWYSHSGSHMNFFTRVPWVNLWFNGIRRHAGAISVPFGWGDTIRGLRKRRGRESHDDCPL